MVELHRRHIYRHSDARFRRLPDHAGPAGFRQRAESPTLTIKPDRSSNGMNSAGFWRRKRFPRRPVESRQRHHTRNRANHRENTQGDGFAR